MSCLFNTNLQGKITSVTAPNGDRSQLFDNIHSNIFMADPETSVRVMMNAFQPDIQNLFTNASRFVYNTGEPMIFYKSTNGREFDNLEDLLINDDLGETMTGFKNPYTEEFIPIAKFTTDSSDRSKFLADSVRQGVLSAERVLGSDGITRMQGKGEFPETRLATARMFWFNSILDYGEGKVVVNKDGTIELPVDDSFVIAENGADPDIIRLVDVPNATQGKNYENVVDLLVQYNTIYNNPKKVDKKDPVLRQVNTKNVEAALNNFLNSLGFEKTTLAEYRKNYNTRYGQDPDIQALSDIANKIVAFQEGIINIEDLSEEIAHIAIEAYNDQNSIVSFITNVHLTPEYTEFAPYYRSKYAEFYEGVDLEEHVRKEVLGKVLAKELTTRFSEENKSPEEMAMTQRLRDLWNQIMNYVRSFFKSYHRTSLNKLNAKIADSVLSGNMADFGNPLTSNNFYYSAMSKESQGIEQTLKASKRVVEDLFSRILTQRVPGQTELGRISDQMTTLNILSSVNTIVGITTNQMSVLETNVKEASQKRELISQMDDGRYRVINENLLPLLTQLKAKMNKLEGMEGNDFKLVNNLTAAIDELLVRKSNIEPLLNSDKEEYVRKMADSVLKDANMTPEQREEEINKIEGNVRDLTWFGKAFGLPSHSNNLLIQMLGKKVVNMGVNVVRKFKVRTDEEIDSIYNSGIQKYQKNIIKKDSKGQRTFYFINPIDYTKYNEDLKNAENQILQNLTEKSAEEISKLRDKFSPSEILKSENKLSQYMDEVKKWKENEGVERRFKAEYYKERDTRFDKVGASPATREYLSNSNINEFNILKPHVNSDGTIDRSRLTEAERLEIINLRKSKEIVRSAYDQFGNLKEGLRRVGLRELTQQEIDSLPYKLDSSFAGEITVLKSGFKLEDLSEDARISLDLSNLNMLYREELQDSSKTRTPTKSFLDQIKTLEAKGEVSYDWVMSNASITLTNDYFDNLGDVVGFADIAQEFIDSLEDEQEVYVKQSLLNEYRELQRIRKDLLRQNRMINNPLETDVKNMMGLVRERIIELGSQIEDKRRALNVPFEMLANQDRSTPRGVNEAFEKMRIESGLSAYNFALKHMSDSDAVKVRDFGNSVKDLVDGKIQYAQQAYERFIQESIDKGIVQAGMRREEIAEILKDEYAKRYVSSYFQRFQPEGYEELMGGLISGQIKVSDVLENRDEMIARYPGLKYLEIVPDYTWSEDVNNVEFMNPNFKPSGYYLKPRTDKYLDDEFFSHYGINKSQYLSQERDDISQLIPTKNIEEYQLLLKMVKLREDSIANYGDTETSNKYQLVQLSSSTFEKYARLRNAGSQFSNVKDTVKDFFYNRKDEKVYGEQMDDDNLMELSSEIGVKIIPKYYQTRLEDPKILTENIIEAGLMDYKQSLIYQERKNVERDVKTLEWKISQQRFLNNGGIEKKNRILKRGEVSNYYDQAVEYINHHLYGIQQTRHFETNILGKSVDISRVVNNVQSMVRFSNLGFNAFVDLTSATTGILSNVTDRLVGDFYHKSSANRANTQLTTMMGGYIAEAGKTQKNTKLNTLLEFFQVEEVDSRIRNTSFNRGLRLIQKSPYLLSKLANMPVTPKVLLTILNDIRFSDGSFRSYNEFTAYQRNSNKEISKSEIDSLWNAIKDDSLYDNMDINSRTIKPNEKFKSKFENPLEMFDTVHSEVVSKAKQVIQSADGVLNDFDQVSAQRDVLTNLFMMHRGWLLINITKRLKKKHYNISTGQVEEGHYRTFGRFLSTILNKLRNRESIKEYYDSLSDYERRNMKRVTVETAIMAAILALGELVLAGDDDDDTALENLAQLIYLRTTSEYNSAQILGMPGSVIETAKSPVVALSTLESLEPLSLFQSIGEEDSEGNSKFFQKVLKATIGKRYNQFSDLQNQLDSFRHFNDPTLLNLGEEKKEE